MILPVTGPAHTEAMCFFEYISVKHLNEYHPCGSWRKTLMLFSQTVPSVRYAAIALALAHRKYLDRDPGDRMHQPQSLRDQLPDMIPLLHYNRAIQLLLNQETGDSTVTTAITLLVCYLLTCFDHVAGNYIQAIQHLRGGVKLSRNIDLAILNNSSTHVDAKFSGVRTLISQAIIQIRRLDMQAAIFLTDWTPADIQETLATQMLPADRGFRSLDDAADHLYILIARVMRMRNAEHEIPPTGERPPPSLSSKVTLLRQLETWSNLFQNMLRPDSLYEQYSDRGPLISLLRLQHTIAWTYLSGQGPDREMEYDKFLPQFQQCVALAGDVAAAHEQYSGSLKPTFTPELGLLPVLYIIGVKCRHPVVRREALGLLRRHPMREAVWDSMCTAKVVERIIEIEEGGSEEGAMARSMEQIAVWQRIEEMSWEHFVSGQFVVRVDMKYTLCTRKGMHKESIIV